MQIQTVCVCGAGTMGRGIAQVTAAAGFATTVYEPNAAVAQAAQQQLAQSVERLLAKGRILQADADRLLEQVQFTQDVHQCRADLVIEAIIEDAAVKRNLFAQLAQFNGAATIMCTNTSSLAINDLATAWPDPSLFAGLHFFNPAPQMQLVEVVKGSHTSDAVIAHLEAFVRRLGKTPVLCADAPGFIVNRVARPYYIEALRQAEAGVPIELIDQVLEARGFRMGPFRLMDLIGNDVNYAVSCSVYEQLQGPERLAPSPLQAAKVAQGQLGRKSGAGFYVYDDAANG